MYKHFQVPVKSHRELQKVRSYFNRWRLLQQIPVANRHSGDRQSTRRYRIPQHLFRHHKSQATTRQRTSPNEYNGLPQPLQTNGGTSFLCTYFRFLLTPTQILNKQPYCSHYIHALPETTHALSSPPFHLYCKIVPHSYLQHLTHNTRNSRTNSKSYPGQLIRKLRSRTVS